MSDTARANPIRHGAFENVAGRVVEGRLQRLVRRTFIARNGEPMTVRELLVRCYPTADRFLNWHRFSIRRALPRYAIPVGRGSGYGPPILWGPNAELLRRIKGDRG